MPDRFNLAGTLNQLPEVDDSIQEVLIPTTGGFKLHGINATPDNRLAADQLSTFTNHSA